MSFGVIKAYMLKEFKELIRSKMIAIVYILPTMIIILFGYGIRMEVTHARTLIVDNDLSKISQDLAQHFQNSKYFDTRIETGVSLQEALQSVKRAKTDILIVIPDGLEKGLIHKERPEVAVFIDGAFPVRASTMENYVKGVIFNAALSIIKESPENLITISSRNLFNQAMRDEDAIVPGLIGLVLLVAPAILSALLIVKEKEEGTIFNFYSSPVSRGEFILAKIIPVFMLHSVNILILFLWATWLFEVPFRGSFFLYWISSELYILSSIGIGLLVSVITRAQIVAIVLTIIITIIPGFLYSGMLMPISSMSGESKIEAHIYPVMYYNHIIYDTFLIGQGLDSPKSRLYLLILALYALFTLFIGSRLIKKEKN
ncbi:MAG: ABC transporter permease [Hydrogenimonas sp.]|nr:ABC transporter permease [Hydrogenimonas sp.]